LAHCENPNELFCKNPFEGCVTCPECWNCDEIEIVAEEVFASLDSNGDMVITSLDYLD
jgi:hypothetical protein